VVYREVVRQEFDDPMPLTLLFRVCRKYTSAVIIVRPFPEMGGERVMA